MKIKEVEDGGLHGVDERLAVETMFRIGDALFEQVEIASADNLLFGREPHDGIEEESQLSFHAVIALRRTQLNEPGCHIDDFASEIIRRFYPFDKFPLADNGQIPRMQLEIPFVETVAASSAQAEQMSQIFLLGVCSKAVKRLLTT